MANELTVLNENQIRNKIYTIRGLQVILDSDLARLYEVEIKRLNEQVKRNSERFPSEFMFQLTELEFKSLRSQNATLKNNSLMSQLATSKNENKLSQNVIPSKNSSRNIYTLYLLNNKYIANIPNSPITD